MKKLWLLLIILAIIAIDQYTKHLARPLARMAPIHYGPLTLTYAENRGAFLSLGANLPDGVRAWLFNGVVAVGLVAVMIMLLRRREPHGDDVPFSLIVAGGIGNLIDRMRFDGAVTDFLYLHAGPLHTGIFNVADMAITAGAVWLLAAWAFSGRMGRT
jgi:signal peptidase II